MKYSFKVVLAGILPLIVFLCLDTTYAGNKVLIDSLRKDSSLVAIHLQQRKVFSFNNHTVNFSNKFASARLNNVTQENDSTFVLTIRPENTPVNPSPWYAFKLWSSGKRRLILRLEYGDYRHRYDPKYSRDGKVWKPLAGVSKSRDKKQATFDVTSSVDTTWIAAQEVISAADSYRWIDSLAVVRGMTKRIIGQSLLGKPIVAINTTGSSGKKLVVVLSRQHPPEVTGYMAMQEFVKTATDTSALARAFRQEYELLVIPMINPDGVDEGNWRHSAAGVDLNRDWQDFRQPETRAVRDFLNALTSGGKARVLFGIDFHSTFYDVFYTNTDTIHTHSPGFTNHWLRAFSSSIPGFRADIKPSGNGGNVSKSWMMRALGAESLTYEVGDNTSREVLFEKGRVAATKMMELLLLKK